MSTVLNLYHFLSAHCYADTVVKRIKVLEPGATLVRYMFIEVSRVRVALPNKHSLLTANQQAYLHGFACSSMITM